MDNWKLNTTKHKLLQLLGLDCWCQLNFRINPYGCQEKGGLSWFLLTLCHCCKGQHRVGHFESSESLLAMEMYALVLYSAKGWGLLSFSGLHLWEWPSTWPVSTALVSRFSYGCFWMEEGMGWGGYFLSFSSWSYRLLHSARMTWIISEKREREGIVGIGTCLKETADESLVSGTRRSPVTLPRNMAEKHQELGRIVPSASAGRPRVEQKSFLKGIAGAGRLLQEGLLGRPWIIKLRRGTTEMHIYEAFFQVWEWGHAGGYESACTPSTQPRGPIIIIETPSRLQRVCMCASVLL